jgi:hypothetical protein
MWELLYSWLSGFALVALIVLSAVFAIVGAVFVGMWTYDRYGMVAGIVAGCFVVCCVLATALCVDDFLL